MPALNIGDVVLVTLQGTLCGQIVLNTFNYQIANATAGATTTEAAAQLNSQFETAGNLFDLWMPLVPTNYTLTLLTIQKIGSVITGNNTRAVADQFIKARVGLSPNGHASTPNIASVLSRKTDQATRAGNSSLHVPFGIDGSVRDDGTIDAATTTALQALGAYILPTIVLPAASWLPVIVGKTKPTSDTPPRQPTFRATQITHVVVRPTIRVMRRRTVGVGK